MDKKRRRKLQNCKKIIDIALAKLETRTQLTLYLGDNIVLVNDRKS